MISSAQFSKSIFNLSDPTDAYLYLFGRVTDNYSETDRFNHIRNWFINRTGIYRYTSTDRKYHDEEVELKTLYAKDKYLIAWNLSRSKQQKFLPSSNKVSEPRLIYITAHVQYLIKTFLAAYRKPSAEQNAAQLYQNEQGIISGLLNIRTYIEQSIANKATQLTRRLGEFLYTGPAAKSSWTLNTYVDWGIEIPVYTIAKAIEIDMGIWHAEWCVYNEGTNEGYIFKANCFTVSAGISLINSKFGGKYLQYLKKNHSQKIMELVSKLTPKGKQILERILSTNITIGRADLSFNVNIYETGGPITKDSFNGNLETGTMSLSGAVAGVASQVFLISEEIAYATPRPYINPKTGGNLPLPPDKSYTRPKAAILIEGINNNNSLGASVSVQRGFGRCYTGESVDYRKYMSWFS